MIGLSKDIVELLNADTTIQHGKAYNLIQDDKSGMRFMVVSGGSVSGNYAKDFKQYDDVRFSIVCLDTGYDKVIETAQKLRDKFESQVIAFTGYSLVSIEMVDFKEQYSKEGSYIGTITFEGKTFEN